MHDVRGIGRRVARPLAVGAAAAAVLTGTAWSLYSLARPAAPAAGEATTSYDPSDPRQLVGSARDVFHGTVLRHTGHEEIAELPSEVYEVRVGRVFKGVLHGTVTVTQTDSEAQPDPGSSYVFATYPWAHEAAGAHAILSDARAAPDLGARAEVPKDMPLSRARAVEARQQTVAEYWTWAVAHQIGTS
ncbi:hypothetical protein ACFWZ2_06650 [Streptomyces sp. NPDC059002]|uniref:hypothetical protein n=1 Tax=Streptomyces sp. NPDC059002 TaxID=3346690 RepID=UPI00368C2DCE